MNLKPTGRLARSGVPRLELTAMIDIIFLLLIYFILSTTYEPPESQLSPALQVQREGAGRAAELTPQIVDVAMIDRTPGFRLGSQVIRDKRELTGILRQLPKTQGLIVRGADDVQTSWAAAALQSARDAGFVKVTYVPAS